MRKYWRKLFLRPDILVIFATFWALYLLVLFTQLPNIQNAKDIHNRAHRFLAVDKVRNQSINVFKIPGRTGWNSALLAADTDMAKLQRPSETQDSIVQYKEVNRHSDALQFAPPKQERPVLRLNDEKQHDDNLQFVPPAQEKPVLKPNKNKQQLVPALRREPVLNPNEVQQKGGYDGDQHVRQIHEDQQRQREQNGGKLQQHHQHDKQDTVDSVENKPAGIIYPRFVERGASDGPGEGGAGGPWKRNNLNPDEQKEWDLGFQLHDFNQFASDRISVHRSIKDNRPQTCKDAQYPDSLPSCTVIMVFHNEAWSVLLRSVHSILDNTPSHLLHSILLVDDKSTMDHLGKPLEHYFHDYPKVKIVRAPQREGLIRGRLRGFQYVTTEIAIFLDSHIECMSGWYQPLVAPIARDYRAATIPLIDFIMKETLEYGMTTKNNIGTVDLRELLFSWMVRSDVAHVSSPIPSPTMPGGLFAISRRWFQELGTYDPGLKIWGGENIELSLKVWMCNGSILMVPCSRIGHIFRDRNPNVRRSAATTIQIQKNSMRVAAVWMGRCVDYFTERLGSHKNVDIGDISARVALREQLHCHDFPWYVNNVVPELKQEIDTTAPYSGEIRNEQVCIDSGAEVKKATAQQCHGMGRNQFWLLTAGGALKQNKLMYFRYGEGKFFISNWPLGTPEWRYEATGALVHVPSGQCVQRNAITTLLLLAPCQNSRWQRWTMQPRPSHLLQPL